MMKPIWNGSLSFGLVTIPVKLYKAVQEHVFGFTLLCATCHKPVHYSRWCNHCNKEVEWNHVLKGLEVRKGQYIAITPEAIKKLKPEKSSTIDVIAFIPADLIAPIYFEHHYYVAPASAPSEKAFFLFHQAIKSMNKVAIGKFVLRDKEYVVAIQTYENGIVLSTLNYAYEIRSMKKIPELTAKKSKASPAELKLAKQLIEQLSKNKFDINDFKDNYAENLKKLIKQQSKSKGKHVKLPKEPKKIKKSHSLIDSLRDSLAEARA